MSLKLIFSILSASLIVPLMSDIETINEPMSETIENLNEDDFYKGYEQTKIEDSVYYTMHTFVAYVPRNSTKIQFTVSMTFKLFAPLYKARLYYTGSDNVERLYSEDDAKAKITAYDKYYEYPVSLEIGDNAYYIFSFEIQPYRSAIYKVLSFRIDFPTNDKNLAEQEKIYYGYECMGTVGRHHFYNARATSFISAEKNQYYYHKFSFKNFAFSYSKYQVNSGTPYLYIYDNSTRFSNALTTLSGKPINMKFLELEYIYNGVTSDFILTSKEQLYYSQTSNFMYKNNDEGLYVEVNDAIHMPRLYYEEYKVVTMGIYIENFSIYGYNFYYEFEVSFEENYIQDAGVIYKDEKIVNGSASGTEIIL